MALRWTASALLANGERVRRIMGYQQLWILEAVLKERDNKETIAAQEKVA